MSSQPAPSALVEKVLAYVKQYMSAFDGSHDFTHILRVVAQSHAIYDELTSPAAPSPSPPLDRDTITLCALLHDVGDRKYLLPGEDASTMVLNLLVSYGAPREFAAKVQTICLAVSYTSEVKDPGHVAAVIARHPELAVVQDADRLDAIGAVGIGRVFAFGGAKAKRGMQDSVEHFDAKLLRVGELMKTAPGRRMAEERTERLRIFKGWWEEEAGATEAGVEWV